MKTTIALILLVVMLIAGACGCQHFSNIIFEGHVTARYLKVDIPVLRVVGAWGDTADIRTTFDVYANYPDIYYRSPADSDSLLDLRPSMLPPNWWQRDTCTTIDSNCTTMKRDIIDSTGHYPTTSDRYPIRPDIITVIRRR